MSQNQPFNPDEFAKWLVEGVKDTLQYRLRQTLNKERWLELIKSKIPTRGQIFHQAFRQAFQQNGFQFELLKQGDAPFHLIRKTFKKEGKVEKRLIMIPGFGDTPTSWITTFAFCKKEIEKNYDELIVIDFPGYLGFLSHTQMVPSMDVLLNVVQMVCEANPPSALIGHSLGGSLAGRVAQKLKHPVEHLILIAPSGLPPESEKRDLGDFILKLKDLPFEEMLKKLVHRPKKFYHLAKSEFEIFYSKPEIREFIDSVKAEHFIDPAAPFMAKNLTVIWGDEDQFVPSHWMRNWVECFGPYLDAYFINKTGHLPQMESPKATADLLKKILFSKPLATEMTTQETAQATEEASAEKRWKKISTHTQQFDVAKGPKPSEPSAPLLSHAK